MVVKTYLFCSLSFLLFSLSFSQNTTIPDANFEQALINLGYDVGPPDGIVPTANINTITELDVSLLNIADLSGIEDFTALEILECSENNLTQLDVSKNSNLQQLFCSFNAIESLDLTQNAELRIIWCNFNRISALDLSNNSRLLSLICSNNLLTNIDVSKNIFLNTFFCIGNQLTNIDVTSNSELRIFHCGNNNINTLNVSLNPFLIDLNFEYNNLNTIDLSSNPELEFLYGLSNNLTALDISNNPNLSILSCGENQLSELNLTANPNLTELLCNSNNLTFLDISLNRMLHTINCSNNNICQLNVKNTNNTNFLSFDSTLNNDLVCVLVDNINYSENNWFNIDAQSRFVSTRSECTDILDDFLNIDVLVDVFVPSYTLPPLSFGSYFTEPFGNGTQLNAGSVINTSQTIYVYNANECYENQSSFNVFITIDGLFIPKYFTPNNDGINDYWKVIDTNDDVNNITIYNRYGKLIKFLPTNSKGWNGTLNNKLLPNDSYWYEIVLNSSEILRGYFALKR